MNDILLAPGISIELLGGFAAAVLISWIIVDHVILALYNRRFKEILRGNLNLTGNQVNDKSNSWRERLDLDFGRRIASLANRSPKAKKTVISRDRPETDVLIDDKNEKAQKIPFFHCIPSVIKNKIGRAHV